MSQFICKAVLCCCTQRQEFTWCVNATRQLIQGVRAKVTWPAHVDGSKHDVVTGWNVQKHATKAEARVQV